VVLRRSPFSRGSLLPFCFNLCGFRDSVSAAPPLPMLWLNSTHLLRPSFSHLTLPSTLMSNCIIPLLCLEQLLLFYTYFLLLISFAFLLFLFVFHIDGSLDHITALKRTNILSAVELAFCTYRILKHTQYILKNHSNLWNVKRKYFSYMCNCNYQSPKCYSVHLTFKDPISTWVAWVPYWGVAILGSG